VVIVCVPAPSDEVPKVAIPFVKVPAPRMELSSLKVTEPEGVPPPLVTDAEIVIACPAIDGFGEDWRSVVEFALAMTSE
jgi:hypothetical protein